MRRIGLLLTLALILPAACTPPASNPDLETGPVITASTTFLADMARNVAGNRMQIRSLLPPGMDPHEYQAVPSDVRKIAQSTAVIVNGLGYEQFMQPLLENAGGTRLILTASDGLEPRRVTEATGEAAADPHMWMSPTRVVKYVENIRDGLSSMDPQGADIYQANAEAYISQLNELDSWIMRQVAQIPAERRVLVTNHDSLGYFSQQYGFRVIGTVIPGVSSEAAPSARQMSALIDEIKSTGAPAVFLDISDDPLLADQIKSETRVTVVTDLYIETLSPPDGPAATYMDMMKHDVARMVEALK